MKTVIIGAGLAGLAAAYRLAESDEIVIIEREPEPGGMASSYSINTPDTGAYHIEEYYHHIFAGDKELIALIDELGLGDRLEWQRGTTGYYFNGRIYPMNTPFEILRALPLVDVIRLTLLVLRAKAIKDRSPYDNMTAREWIYDTAGESVYNNFFEPLLQSKFGDNKEKVSAAWLLGRVQIRSNRGTKGERLGYMRGGFNALIEAMADNIRKKGGKIVNGTVSQIEVADGSVQGVVVDKEHIRCDRVISTVVPRVLEKIIDTGLLGHNLDISYQGTACALFGLTERIMDDIYWLNIKEDVPFGAVIEHTNFIPASDYGEHLMYATSYFQSPDSVLWRSSDEEVIELYLGGLEKLFPGFREKVKWWRLRRDMDTAPVYEVGYGKKILPYVTGIKGLYLAGMFSQANYPERSMNGSVVAGFKCAEAVKEGK
ncbi:protoporphyrinogen oxidase [Candidatus Methanoperedens nitroreducens]|uniref:Protoporphyrinogen oxidase n=1 Tax=Candidatus Methanoperedens nitratireducens TaxID=1392998 RepID=A0A062V8G4_9EURY|nr:NAD(P)/FAD-dependent oxidoreductase [Candidatus Methanoperedens nitroreducens]KCZ72044.1 protoporphyrinogen oxidase [Candidatus Methanoperedens nitroreducens]MDJ1421980.1 NAD(P)/FAD-dependent oxidoreductase [Candidatus Methanoperedens sp.]